MFRIDICVHCSVSNRKGLPADKPPFVDVRLITTLAESGFSKLLKRAAAVRVDVDGRILLQRDMYRDQTDERIP